MFSALELINFMLMNNFSYFFIVIFLTFLLTKWNTLSKNEPKTG